MVIIIAVTITGVTGTADTTGVIVSVTEDFDSIITIPTTGLMVITTRDPTAAITGVDTGIRDTTITAATIEDMITAEMTDAVAEDVHRMTAVIE